MKKLILLLSAGFLSAQSLQPTIGVRWIGGFQYQMEVEAPGAQLGLKFAPKKPNIIMSDAKLSFDYYADVIPEKPGTRNDFYQAKIQFSKPFAEYWSFQYYAGYSNAFDGNIMKIYDGPFKTNFSYGLGLQTSDDMIDAELMFEMMSGYPMLSIGASYKFKNLIKKNR